MVTFAGKEVVDLMLINLNLSINLSTQKLFLLTLLMFVYVVNALLMFGQFSGTLRLRTFVDRDLPNFSDIGRTWTDIFLELAQLTNNVRGVDAKTRDRPATLSLYRITFLSRHAISAGHRKQATRSASPAKHRQASTSLCCVIDSRAVRPQC